MLAAVLAMVVAGGGEEAAAHDPTYKIDFAITSGPNAGPYAASEPSFTHPIYFLPEHRLNGPTVFGGYGCDADNDIPARASAGLRPLAAREEAIVVLEEGRVDDPAAPYPACRFDEKVQNAEDAGYDGVLIARRHEGSADADAVSCQDGDERFIPGACVPHEAMHRIFGETPSYERPYTRPNPNEPAPGQLGEDVVVTATEEPGPPPPQCSDGTDNDGDGENNFPDDQGCSSAEDDSESPDSPQCSDRLDNDGDGKVNGADPGCTSAADDSESPDPRPPARECSDGRDNDRDGRTDHPADPGCGSRSDDSESPDPAPTRECTITRGAGNDVVRGTRGDDVICAGDGDDIVYGGGGNDVIRGGAGHDALHGQGGYDRVVGELGTDQLTGADGDDRLSGGRGNDTLNAGNGSDQLHTRDGVRGNDVANGGAGNDACASDPGDGRGSC